MADREKRIEAVTDKYRSRFALISIAVDTVTWCSFCVITIGILLSSVSRMYGAKWSIQAYFVVASAGAVAALLAFYALYIFEKMLEEVCDALKQEPGATGALFRTFGSIVPIGTVILSMIIVATLSFQALSALGLLAQK